MLRLACELLLQTKARGSLERHHDEATASTGYTQAHHEIAWLAVTESYFSRALVPVKADWSNCLTLTPYVYRLFIALQMM